MRNYLKLMNEILTEGTRKSNRTGVDTIDLFGKQLRFDLRQGFPLLTTKKVFFKGIAVELLWFLRGDTNIKFLHEHDVHIWDEWADERGDLGPVYGYQWRHWPGVEETIHGPRVDPIDQLKLLIDDLKNKPDSRRHIVTAWNPSDISQMKLPPCHCFFQCDVTNGHLSLHMYQRSADYFLGVPFNIASYALLVHMLAQVTGYLPGELIISYGSVHLYENHLEQAKLQLSRTPGPLPRLELNHRIREIDAFKLEDIRVEGYRPHPPIKAEVAV